MPSGHSSMASSAMYFVGRRYGWWHLIYMLPILLMTMFARVALDAHTISAVLAGALAGIVGAALFTSSFPPQVNIEFVKNEILRIGRASSR
nr:phosphatase PAP2 family protein [Herbaspirillum aquaticum]